VTLPDVPCSHPDVDVVGPESSRARSEPAPLSVTSTVLVSAQFACLACSIVLTLAQVIYRYVLRSSPELIQDVPDLLTILFTWIIFLGIPRAIIRDSSVRIGSARIFPESWRPGLAVAGKGATGAFFGFVAASYLEIFSNQTHTQMTTLPVPSAVATFPILIASVLSLLYLAWDLATTVRSMGQMAALVIGIAIPCLTLLLQLPGVLAAIVDIVLLLLLDCPVAVALGIGGAAAIVNGVLLQVSIIAGQLAVPTANIALLAIPLFMFMGALFANSRLSDALSRFVRALLGWLPGGVGLAAIGTSAVFANITGSAVADTAAIGAIYVPEMIEAGYPAADAAALQGAAGVIGVIFPPSVAMILFATVAAVNVTTVFEAVLVPGLITAITMMIVAVFVARHRKIANPQRFKSMDLLRSIPGAIPVLLIPLILDGGIFSGIFSPAESGAVAIVVVFALAVVIGGARWRDLGRAASQAMDNTTLVAFILISVSLLDYAFVTSGIQSDLTQFLTSVGRSPLLILIVVNVIFIIAHEFIDAGPAIVVLIPLVLPAVIQAGVSPYQLAAVVAVNSSIGAILPPVGIPIYVASRLANTSAMQAFRRVVPYVLASTCVLALITVFPSLSLSLTGSR
jgi:C4-dicarboxylate transporter DctM subunit